ncbi:hypothetical protein EVG20_g8788 [Dentipellis fragilis]|uniref:Uncharacterized protein n=1 Tax=Dentipellis fragilis TaxID=205917 RepID=A0A4Y9Y5B0_9AGAM|nr:hypothetical protein EVG20_g8788 [Dentipellis fragilis]
MRRMIAGNGGHQGSKHGEDMESTCEIAKMLHHGTCRITGAHSDWSPRSINRTDSQLCYSSHRRFPAPPREIDFPSALCRPPGAHILTDAQLPRRRLSCVSTTTAAAAGRMACGRQQAASASDCSLPNGSGRSD